MGVVLSCKAELGKKYEMLNEDTKYQLDQATQTEAAEMVAFSFERPNQVRDHYVAPMQEEVEDIFSALKFKESLSITEMATLRKYYRERFSQASTEELPELFSSIADLGNNAIPFIPNLIQALYHEKSAVRYVASESIYQIYLSQIVSVPDNHLLTVGERRSYQVLILNRRPIITESASMIFSQILNEFEHPTKNLPDALIRLLARIGSALPEQVVLDKARINKMILEGNEHTLRALSISLGEAVIGLGTDEIEEAFTPAFEKRWANAKVRERMLIIPYYEAINKNIDPTSGLSSEDIRSLFKTNNLEYLLISLKWFYGNKDEAKNYKKEILSLLKHEDPEVRIAALEVLSVVGIETRSERKAIRTLRFEDSRPYIRKRATAELRSLNDRTVTASLGLSSQAQQVGPKLEVGASLRRQRWEFGLAFQYTNYVNLFTQEKRPVSFLGALAQSSFHIFKYSQKIDPQILPLQIGLGVFFGQNAPWMVINPPGLGFDIPLKYNKPKGFKLDLTLGVKPRMITDFSSKPAWGADAEFGFSGHF